MAFVLRDSSSIFQFHLVTSSAMRALLSIFAFCLPFAPLFAAASAQSQSVWVPTNGPYGGTVMDLKEGHDGVLYAATGAGLFDSRSRGQYWSPLDLRRAVTSVAVDAGLNVYAGTSGLGVYYKNLDTDKTLSADGPWLLIDEGLRQIPVMSLLITAEGGVLAATGSYKWLRFSHARYGGIYSLTPHQTWEERTGVIDYNLICSLHEHPEGAVFAAAHDGVYRSMDDGLRWSRVHHARIHDIGIRADGTVVLGWNGNLLVSDDLGDTWQQAATLPENCCLSLHYGPDGRLWGYSNGYAGAQVRYSDDGGATWEPSGFATIHIHKLLPLSNRTALAGTHFRGVYNIDPDGGTVTKSNAGIHATDVSVVKAVGDSLILAGTAYDYDCGDYCGSLGAVYRSTNRGNSWDRVLMANSRLTDFAFDAANHIVYATGLGGLYRSVDLGRTWEEIEMNINGGEPWCGGGRYKLHVSEQGALHVGFGSVVPLLGGGIARSVDGGESWTCAAFDESPTDVTGFAQDASGRLYAGWYNGVVVSDDDGETWSALGAELEQVRALAASGDQVFAIAGGVYRLNTDRTDWEKTPFHVPNPTALAVDSDGHAFVATRQNGIYSSSNIGESWQLVDDGLTGVNIAGLSFSTDGVAYASTIGRGVYRNQAPTVSAEAATGLPLTVRLRAVYPNPFSTQSTVVVSLPRSEFVALTVYNMLGQEITRLAEGRLESGEHTFTWRPENLPPGVYALSLVTPRGAETRVAAFLGAGW